MNKLWDENELIAKYPIKNIWEWEYTGNVITSKKRLFEIKDDPWNRDFAKQKILSRLTKWDYWCMVTRRLSKKEIRLWSFV